MDVMRRQDRKISDQEAIDILDKGEYGTLSMVSNGRGYGIPISYSFKNNKIYLHCAKEGQKLKALRENNLVSFSVVGDTEVLASKFSTKFESVIIHGTARFLEDEEKFEGLYSLIEKYSPDFLEAGKKYIEKSGIDTDVIAIDIEVMTGKARR